MKIELLLGDYSISRFDKDYKFSLDLGNDEFASVARTREETSIVCQSGSLSNFQNIENGWRVFRVLGPLDFGQIGIISRISTIMAEKAISIFVISTYDTDYFMVKDEKVNDARHALAAEGYEMLA